MNEAGGVVGGHRGGFKGVFGGHRSRLRSSPPRRRLGSEAPPFVCHLFTLLGRGVEERDNELLDQQLGLNEAALLYPLPPERSAPRRARD